MQTVVGNFGKKEQTPIDAFSHDIDCGPIGRRPLYKAYGKLNATINIVCWSNSKHEGGSRFTAE